MAQESQPRLAEATDEQIEAAIGIPIDDADRQVLSMLREYLESAVLLAAEQTAGTSRWLLASLLAVNGGAILASLNSTEISGSSERWAIGLWLLGILLALGSGFVSMNGGRQAIKIGSDMLSKVITCLQLGTMQDLRFEKEQQEIQTHIKRAIGVGLSSLTAFVAGCLVLLL